MDFRKRFGSLRAKGLTSFEILLVMVAEIFPESREDLSRTDSLIEEIYLLFYQDHTGYKVINTETEIGTFHSRERNKKRIPFFKKTEVEEKTDEAFRKEGKDPPLRKQATRPSYDFVEKKRLAESLQHVKTTYPHGMIKGWNFEQWNSTDNQTRVIDTALSRAHQNKFVKDTFLKKLDVLNSQDLQHFEPMNETEEEFMSTMYGSYLSVPAPVSAYLSGVFAYYLSMLHLDLVNADTILEHFRHNKAIGLVAFMIRKGLMLEDPVMRNGRLFRAKFSGVVLCLFYSYYMLEAEMMNISDLAKNVFKEKAFMLFSDPGLKIVGSMPLSKSALFIKNKKVTAKFLVDDLRHRAVQEPFPSPAPAIPVYDDAILAKEQEVIAKMGSTVILKYMKSDVLDRDAAAAVLIDPRMHTRDDSWANFSGIPNATIEEGNNIRLDFTCKPFLLEYLDSIFHKLYPKLTFRAIMQGIFKAGGPNASGMGPIKIGTNKLTKEDVNTNSKSARLSVFTPEIISSLYGNPKKFSDLSEKNTHSTWRTYEIPVELRKNFLYFTESIGKRYERIELPRYKMEGGILVRNDIKLSDYEYCGMVSGVVIRNVPGKKPRVAIAISLADLVGNAFGVLTNMIQKDKDFRYEIGTGNASSNPLDTIVAALSDNTVSIGYDAEAFDQHAGNGYSIVITDKIIEKIAQTANAVMCDEFPTYETLREAVGQELVTISKDGLIRSVKKEIIGVAIHPLASSVVYMLIRMKMFYAKPVNRNFSLMLEGIGFPGSDKLLPLNKIGTISGYFLRANLGGTDSILACIPNGAVPSGELNTLSYNSIIERSVGKDMSNQLEIREGIKTKASNITGDDLLLVVILPKKEFDISKIAQIGVDTFHSNGFKSARDKQEMLASFYIKVSSSYTDLAFPVIPHFSQEREPTGISAVENLLVKADKLVLNTAAGLNDPMGSMLMLSSALWTGWDEISTSNRDIQTSIWIPLSVIFLPPSLGGLGVGLYSMSFKKSIDFLWRPPTTQEGVDWYSRGRSYANAISKASTDVEGLFKFRDDFDIRDITALKLNYRTSQKNLDAAKALDPDLKVLKKVTDGEFKSIFLGTVHRVKYQIIRRVPRIVELIRMDNVFEQLREKISYKTFDMPFDEYYLALQPTSSFLASIYKKTGIATSVNDMINLLQTMSESTGISINTLFESFNRSYYDKEFATSFLFEIQSLGVSSAEINNLQESLKTSDLLAAKVEDAWTNKSQSLINQRSMASRVVVNFADGVTVDTHKGFNPFILYMLHLMGENQDVGAIEVQVDMTVQDFLSIV